MAEMAWMSNSKDMQVEVVDADTIQQNENDEDMANDPPVIGRGRRPTADDFGDGKAETSVDGQEEFDVYILAALIFVFFAECTMSPKSFKRASNDNKDSTSKSIYYKPGAGCITDAWRYFFKQAYAFILVSLAVVLSFVVQIMIPLYAIIYFQVVDFTPQDQGQRQNPKFRDERRTAWMFFFSMPYMVVALRNLAANIQFIELVSDMWARLDGLIHAAKHPDPAHPITERRKMLLQRFATRGWLHAALVLCGLVKVTSFFFAMALLYLMLTSEQQPILTVVPKIVDVLKDIVALDYLVRADVILFETLRVILRIRSPRAIVDNLFGQSDFSMAAFKEKSTMRRMFVKTMIALGTVGTISVSFALAFSSWGSRCFQIFNITNFDDLDADGQFTQRLRAQRCASVFENYDVPVELQFTV